MMCEDIPEVICDLFVCSGESEEVMLPCEFCELLLPGTQLAFHQVSYSSDLVHRVVRLFGSYYDIFVAANFEDYLTE